MTRIALFALATLFASAPARAEETTGPSADVKKLARLAGNWGGTGTFTAEGKKAPFTWLMKCKAAARNFAVECRFTARGIPVIPLYEGTSVIGWDQPTQTVHWYWVTNAGETHDHHGRWTDANTLDVPFEWKDGGKSFRETFTILLSGPRDMHWTSAYIVDGQQAMFLDAKGRK